MRYNFAPMIISLVSNAFEKIKCSFSKLLFLNCEWCRLSSSSRDTKETKTKHSEGNREKKQTTIEITIHHHSVLSTFVWLSQPPKSIETIIRHFVSLLFCFVWFIFRFRALFVFFFLSLYLAVLQSFDGFGGIVRFDRTRDVARFEQHLM